jgi:hypothetical protein
MQKIKQQLNLERIFGGEFIILDSLEDNIFNALQEDGYVITRINKQFKISL